MYTFSSALQKTVVLRLNTMGYTYLDQLESDSSTYWFSKDLGNTTQAVVSFQQQQHHHDTSELGFAVNVGRHSTIQKVIAYPGSGLMMRLPYLLWAYYGLRFYAKPDHWWSYTNTEERQTALDDALTKLVRYGLPWLENPMSGRVVPISRSDWSSFYDAAFEVLSPDLMASGYQPQEDSKQKWHPSRARPSFYFVKRIQSRLYTFLLAHLLQFVKPDLEEVAGFIDLTRPRQPLRFDLILIRNRFADPYADCSSSCRQYWLSRITHVPFSEQPGPFESNLWKYSTNEELTSQLRDALNRVMQIGVPAIENISSGVG